MTTFNEAENTIKGTRGNDNLAGTPERDLITGGNGDDTIRGANGDDTIEGERGGDIIRGNAGNDVLAADRVNRFQDFDGSISELRGDSGNDTIFGGGKDDLIGGGKDDDLLFGKSGNDLIRGAAGNDTLNGGIGNDTLRGQGGIDTADYSDLTFNGVFGTIAGLDVNLSQRSARHSSNNNPLTWIDTITTVENVIGTSRNDRFIGDEQDNIFDGKGQVNREDRKTTFTDVDGDEYQVIADVVEYSGNRADFTFSGSSLEFTVTGSGIGTDTLKDIEFLKFDDGLVTVDDSLFEQEDSDEVINGTDAADNLTGGAGDDTITGGLSNDTLAGNGGADSFIFNSPDEGIDTITDFNSSDGDEFLINQSGFGGDLSVGVLNSSQFTLGGSASTTRERFIYDDLTGDLFFDPDGTGSAAQIQIAVLSDGPILSAGDFVVFPGEEIEENDPFTGGDGNDMIEGTSDSETLTGNAGDDALNGGLGSDTLNGNAGADSFVFNSPDEGIDTITDFSSNDGDTFIISQGGFGSGLSFGTLDPTQFTLGLSASDSSDRFIYDPVAGDLFFDADGTGSAAQIQIAVLTNQADLSADDFVISF